MLRDYTRKRNFDNTPEPAAKKGEAGTHRFVVQRHDATRLHFDFRLEMDGVLKSWAVPKGPSLNPADKRLAVQVEDHPVSYIGFSGTIPEGNYGAGEVEVWDKGDFDTVDEKGEPLTDSQARSWLKRGELKFILHGKKLKGSFALVRLKKDPKNWLLIKHRDRYAVDDNYSADSITTKPRKNPPAVKSSAKKKEKPASRTTAPKNAETTVKDHGMNSGTGELTVKVNRHELKLTHLTKIFWPENKITKGALLNYYDTIAPVILPYLKNRPMSLKRNPDGVGSKGFFQKDAGKNFPSWIKTVPFDAASTGKEVNYTLCNDKATLLYLANLGCIEMNPWNSTYKKPGNPTYLIIDIDPAEKNNFDDVVETVQATAEVLDKAGATFYCKTSGASGMHVYVPLGGKYDYATARDFGKIIATEVQQRLPSLTSLERSLAKRGQKIYIDYLQNSQGQTIASAYSVRPAAQPQVSAPVLLKEIKKGLHPSQFTIFNIGKRVAALGDIFYMALGKGNNLRQCLKRLGY